MHERLLVAGRWVRPAGSASIEVINPATETVIGRVPAADAADVDAAVRAAGEAFDAWGRLSPTDRGKHLLRVAEGLQARASEMARTISLEVGAPLSFAADVQVGTPLRVLDAFLALLETFPFEERVGPSLIVREPVGVAACITPWNYPLHQIISKVAGALAAGCTVVLKPSEVAPLSAFLLAEIMVEADLPPGVFNLVSGAGAQAGEALASHEGVDIVSFTGSTAAGKRVAELAARSVKRVTLELGGKSANILLDDADMERAVSVGVANCFQNSGQTCSAWSRLLVPRAHHDAVAAMAGEVAAGFRLGNPLDPATRLGPLISAHQRDRVRASIRTGLEEGATLITGGPEPPEDLPRGYFVRPTVFADVRPDATIAQEEIFGPVLSIIPYVDEEDAVRIANLTRYGLAGGVWSRDATRALNVARRIRTGRIDINGSRFNPAAPFGGYRQSGIGRELGAAGLSEYLEFKSVQL